MIKKTVTLNDLTNGNKGQPVNGELITADMDWDGLIEIFPDFKGSGVEKTFKMKSIKHIFILMYNDFEKGDQRRQVAGCSEVMGIEEVKAMAISMAGRIGYRVDRMLELKNNSEDSK